MKNALKVLAIVLLVGTTNMALAAGPDHAKSAKLKVQVVEHKEGMFVVHYATADEGIVKLYIKEFFSGTLVHSERIKDHKLAVKKYDLSSLPAGKYIVEVRFGKEVIHRTIKL